MDRINVIDVSSYLLFEATGDSEADADTGNMEEPNEWLCTKKENGEEDDMDAMSCISECDGFNDNGHAFDVIDGDDGECCNAKNGYDDDDEKEEVEEDDVVNQSWKSSGCVDPSLKKMNQREKDRMFWEACLAS